MTSAGIYGILHRDSGKLYVGSSVDIPQRWRQHRSYLRNNKHPNKYLQSAWNKYSEAAFEFVVLEVVCGPEGLIAVEQSYLDSIDTEMTYNLLPLAGTTLGRRMSAETRAKMSAAKSKPRKPLFTEHKASLSRVNKGRTVSDDVKARISTTQQGRVLSEEHKARISAGKKASGFKHSEASRAKIGVASKGRTGYKHSAEALAKIVASNRRRKGTPRKCL